MLICLLTSTIAKNTDSGYSYVKIEFKLDFDDWGIFAKLHNHFFFCIDNFVQTSTTSCGFGYKCVAEYFCDGNGVMVNYRVSHQEINSHGVLQVSYRIHVGKSR